MTNFITNFVYVLNDSTQAMPVYVVRNAEDFWHYWEWFGSGFQYGMMLAGVLYTIGMISKAMGAGRQED